MCLICFLGFPAAGMENDVPIPSKVPVVDRMASQTGPDPQTCEYVAWHGERDFAMGTMQVGPIQSHVSLKGGKPFPAVVRAVTMEAGSEGWLRDLRYGLWRWRRGARAKEGRQSPRSWERQGKDSLLGFSERKAVLLTPTLAQRDSDLQNCTITNFCCLCHYI